MIGRMSSVAVWSTALAVCTAVLSAHAATATGPEPAAENQLPRVPAYSPTNITLNRTEPLPVELTDVELTEKLGERIDLDRMFTDAAGKQVKFADYFDGRTPVILNLTYFRCPMSCPVILQNLAMSLREVKLEPGEGYRVVTVSIDPTDTVAAAAQKQEIALRTLRYAKPGADASAWPFLVGPADTSKALADSVGYGFKYLPGPRQYTHKDVIMILSPEGKITRYLSGQRYPAVPLELTLVEASDGQVGSPVDRFKLLFCYYNTGEKKYALRAKRLMTAGGAVTVLLLGGVLGVLWWKEKRRAQPTGQTE